MPLGGALTGALIPAIVIWSDWKTGALTVGAVALAMMVLLQGLRAGIDADRGAALELDPRRLIEPVRLALTEPRLRGYTLAAFAYAGCQLSVMSFMVVFLTRAVDMSLVLAGSVFASLQLGGFTGRLLWGGLASRLGAPRAVLVAIGLIAAGCLVTTPFMDADWPLVGVIALAALLGASSLGWNGVLLSEVATHAPDGLAVDATAGMQVVMFGGITVIPQTGSFDAAFAAVAVLAVAGALLLARMPRA